MRTDVISRYFTELLSAHINKQIYCILQQNLIYCLNKCPQYQSRTNVYFPINFQLLIN